MDKNMQDPQLNSDELASSLAFVTHLSEQRMPKDAPQSPQNAPEPQEAPQPQQQAPATAQPDMEGLMAKFELNITKQLDSLRKEFKEDTQKEIEGMKNDLKQALSDEENTENQTQKTS